ncbi:MAG: TspO/MBR family protein [Candidatus Magasanikbacteria bacterium]
MQNYEIYASWIRPSWAPPSWLFGPAWTILYILIAISFGYVLSLFLKGKISWLILLPFALNLFFNLIFTPIQFGLKSFLLSSIDIILVWGTIVWLMLAIFPVARWVVYINVPYLLWVSFATVLQITTAYLNR